MPEALAKQAPLPQTGAKPLRERKPAPDILPPILPETRQVPNDNEAIAPARFGERIGFEIPQRIWSAMLACYGVFFVAIFAATGQGGHAQMAIVISLLYTAVYFGVARILAKQAGPQPSSSLDRAGILQTFYGPMTEKAVAAQMLIVPFGLALFAIGILAVRLAVLP
jgi:hypothetical protein